MTPYLRGRSAVRILILVVGASLFVSSAMFASTQPWEQAAFAADPQAVLSAAKAIEVGKDAEVDVFLAERRYVIDEQGCVTRTTHWVYRVNTNDGVKNWADVSAGWEPWHQVKPEINVRVITPDGGVHMLDTKTLIDAPSRGNAEATFEDDRSYHGPIPAVSLGAMPVASAAASAKLDDETRARIAAEQAGGAFHIADRLGFDDVIDPRDLRNALLQGLDLTEGRAGERLGPVRAHGITP